MAKQTATQTQTKIETEIGPDEHPVLVTTEHRGVFFGYTRNPSCFQAAQHEILFLRRARMAVYWSEDMKGVLGLAASGPSKMCRIGPPADIALRNITMVTEVTPEAVQAWEKQPWG